MSPWPIVIPLVIAITYYIAAILYRATGERVGYHTSISASASWAAAAFVIAALR